VLSSRQTAACAASVRVNPVDVVVSAVDVMLLTVPVAS